jgi:hypothetical protein
VLRHARLADADLGDQITDSPFVFTKKVEDLPAMRLSQHIEHALVCLFSYIPVKA